MRILGIRVTRTADEWLCLLGMAGMPFMPSFSYEMLAELLKERARHEASRRDEEWWELLTRSDSGRPR